jgi:hypothetical protein
LAGVMLNVVSVILRCERRSREPRRRRPERIGRILRGPLRDPIALARRCPSRPPQDDGSPVRSLVLAMRLHPSYAKATNALPPQKRREAERRKAQCLGAAPCEGAAARCAPARSPLGAPPRRSPRLLPLGSTPGRASWNYRVQTGGPSPAPVQRAPRRPVVLPAGSMPGAARY